MNLIMKRTILLLAFTLITNLSFSQTNENQNKEIKGTTIEEYNYMTKGFKIQQSSGLDMKSGYSIDNIASIVRGNYTFSFNALIRVEEKELAGILIIANSQVSGRDYYLGMPMNNEQLQTIFEKDIKSWDESMTTAYAQSLSKLYSKTNMLYYLKKN